MNPDDFTSNDEALSAMAGILWAVYSRLIGEGASPFEASSLAAKFTAAMIHGAPPTEGS